MWKTCSRGHRFLKSKNCPVCPICWPGQRKKLESDFPKLSAPALRALHNAGIKNLKALSKWSERELLELHGFGKSSLPKLRSALRTKGLMFKK